jgi:TonB-dependent Receptor Plug Domain
MKTPPTYRFTLPIVALAAFAAGFILPAPVRADSAAAPSPVVSTPPATPAPPPAAPDPDVTTLEEYTVSGAALADSTLPERPVSALYGYAVPYQDVPRSIAQITPEQFQNDIINSVNDFARYSPSTSLLTGAAVNAGTPYFRGSQGDLYQNGVRLLTRGTNNRPFTLNPYESADLVAGPASVIFGPSARTAGYVNYITKQPYFDQERGVLNIDVGQWFDGVGYKLQDSAQIDVGAPIIPGKLAFRVSYEADSTDSYYQNTHDSYNNFFAALGWRPNATTALDFNLEYGHYDWIVNNFQNRVTQNLIDNGTYLAGPATPIIQVGSAYYSPVLNASGAATGGWITRAKVTGANGLTYYNAGAAVSNPTSNTTAGAGTVVGYVLDPTLVQPEQISPTASLNDPAYPTFTDTINFQTRLKREVSENLTLVNSLTYGRYLTDSSSNGGFYNYILANSIEDRVEAQVKRFYKILGIDIEHDSNSGLDFRWEPSTNFKDSENTGYGPTGDYYNLAGNPLAFNRNSFFGATVYPFTGLVTTPVQTNFGYLKGFWQYLPVPQSQTGGATTPGGSASGTPAGTLGTADYYTLEEWGSFFSQHTFKVGNHFILDLGVRESFAWAHASNPLYSPNVPGNSALSGSVRVSEPSYSSSLSYKPVSWLTAYFTYDYVTATDGNTSGAVGFSTTLAGVTNQLDPYNFKSVSELGEAGAKAELIPDKLFLTVDSYRQTREGTLALPAGAAANANPIQALGLYQGDEVSLRYQPAPNFSVGANYSYLAATNLNSTFSAPAPIVANNSTNILGATTAVKGVNTRIVNLPHNTASAYATYQFSSGFGIKADLSAHDSYWVATDGSVTVPGNINLDLGVYYENPAYRIALDVQNATDQHDHAGGATPLPGTNAGLRVSYRF